MKLTIVLSFLLILSSFLVLSHTHGKVVAAWLFDEGARGIGKTASGIIEDVSGNGHDGEIIGEVRWQPGKFRTALAGRFRTIGPVWRFADTPAEIKTSPPTLGQHTDEVLTGLGMREADLQQLRAARIVG